MKKQAKRLEAAARKRSTADRFSSLSSNEVAKLISTASDGFLWSPEWRSLRAQTLKRYGHRCMCCGYEPKDLRRINVDHIKPRKLFPELALDPENLQVLCARCNKAKGNKHTTDYRSQSSGYRQNLRHGATA